MLGGDFMKQLVLIRHGESEIGTGQPLLQVGRM